MLELQAPTAKGMLELQAPTAKGMLELQAPTAKGMLELQAPTAKGMLELQAPTAKGMLELQAPTTIHITLYMHNVDHLEYVGEVSEVEDVVELDGSGEEGSGDLQQQWMQSKPFLYKDGRPTAPAYTHPVVKLEGGRDNLLSAPLHGGGESPLTGVLGEDAGVDSLESLHTCSSSRTAARVTV